MGDHLPAIEIEPNSGAATAAVIWLHGLGADGNDFAPVVPMLDLPHVRFVFPHAPQIPVTINNGWVMRAWYDIRSLDRRPDREDPTQIRASAAQIAALLDREVARGIPSARIVLAGFSQGGAMTLYTGLRYPSPLAGLLALSAYMLLPESLAAEAATANAATPICAAHGKLDDLVPRFAGRAALDQIAAVDRGREASVARDVRWHEYPIGHEVSPAELAMIAAWLRERLPA